MENCQFIAGDVYHFFNVTANGRREKLSQGPIKAFKENQ